MSGVRIRLEPLGRTLEVAAGTPLHDLLFPFGVEFPCGGRGRCGRCRVEVVHGEVEGPDDARAPGGAWLACRCRAASDATIAISQWETPVLADETAIDFTPGEGLGIALDVGSTTVVAQAVDLHTGHVVGVRAGLNPQVKYGADIMSRVEFALAGGATALRDAIRALVESMVRELASLERPRRVVLVGNTVMHHLFCGIPVEPLSHYPFEPVRDGLVELDGNARFLPCLGGFVGSDILAGILATGIHRRAELSVLIDLGTNGEIVVGNRDRLLCCSTAAGPAFEGGRIQTGMRAATGAISEVFIAEGALCGRVLGGGAARGICGSGLVDAVAGALELGLVLPTGRLAGGARELSVRPPVALTQADIRELQLAKAAIAAGVRILLRRWGADTGQVDRVYLAGAFGNYLNPDSAERIGLLDFEPAKVRAAGNTALLGAKLALFEEGEFAELRRSITHIPLGADREFQEEYVKRMALQRKSLKNTGQQGLKELY